MTNAEFITLCNSEISMSESDMRKVIIILNNKGDHDSVMIPKSSNNINVKHEILDLESISLPVETSIIDGRSIFYAKRNGVTDSVVLQVLKSNY